MSDQASDVTGGIPLHDRHAIGLQLVRGRIGLHRAGTRGWMIGVRLNVDMRHYRKEGATGGFMNLEHLQMSIPSPNGFYTGRIEGWDWYKTSHYDDYYKPQKCQLLPDHPEFTVFAWMDAWDEPDPWFYFGWGLRTDHLPVIGFRRRTIVAYMGANYPIEDYTRPSWVNIPSEEELLRLVNSYAPKGEWNVRARFSGFTVDPEPTQPSYLTIRVWKGRRRFHIGILDFVSSIDRIVGEDDSNWTGEFWGSFTNPGELKMLSGAAEGRTFRVVGAFYSGENPQPGCPPFTWCVRTHPDDPAPYTLGVRANDRYQLAGPWFGQFYELYEFRKEYGPGVYLPQDFDFTFTPIL